jgi:hypothetical protein
MATLCHTPMTKGLFDPPKLGLQSYGPDNEQWMNALMQLFSILVQSQTAMQVSIGTFRVRH